jgi:hypothetical protein
MRRAKPTNPLRNATLTPLIEPEEAVKRYGVELETGGTAQVGYVLLLGPYGAGAITLGVVED